MHAHVDRNHATQTGDSERRLLIVLVITATYMLGDVLGLAMAVAAIRFARRPATAGKTYGFYRSEILAALVNSILLIVVAAWILYAAWQRLNDSSNLLPRV